MAWTPAQCGLDAARARAADTAIFVDVDGVLNVGTRDEGGSLMLNDAGMEDALKLWGKHERHPMRDTIERLVSMARRQLGHGEGSTYAKLASVGSSEFSEVLVGRLAALIRAAGDRGVIVLSSKWKRHRARVKRLEGAISTHLERPFAFDATTAPEPVTTPEARLESIGDFLQGFCEWRGGHAAGSLRALVLEDFHITPLGAWSCGGSKIASVAAAEEYLRRRAPSAAARQVSVTIVHTYDEWRTPQGLRVQVGAGLTMQHFCRAVRVFGKGCDYCGQPNGEPAAIQNIPESSADHVAVIVQPKRTVTTSLMDSEAGQPPAKLQKLAPKTEMFGQRPPPSFEVRLGVAPSVLSALSPTAP